jgi:4'-phosphopantetheinyl transferase EntD
LSYCYKKAEIFRAQSKSKIVIQNITKIFHRAKMRRERRHTAARMAARVALSQALAESLTGAMAHAE